MSVNGSVLSRLALSAASTGLSALRGWPAYRPLPASPTGTPRPHREYQDALWALYEGAGVYSQGSLWLELQGTPAEPLRALRLAAHRSVEFFVATIWPGVLPDALPIEADNEAILPAIEQVWQWSNWSSQKQVFIRKAASMGEVFVKVAQTPNGSRVYFQLIDPRHVVDLDTDERGYLTRIRIDVPKTEPDSRDRSHVKTITRTEVWEKTVTYFDDGTQTVAGGVRVWEHDKGDEPDLDKLGDPLPADSKTLDELGLTFLPLVQMQFCDVGEPHGASAYGHAVEKLLEADRSVSRLHQQLYRANTETWVLEAAGRVDSLGREIPPPQVDGLGGSSTRDDGRVQVGDARLVRVPSGWAMNPKIAPLDYDAARNISNDHGGELAKDLPELHYFDAAELGANASGRARRIHLQPAIDRAVEARANCEDALIRLNQMALTIGKNAGLALFKDVGAFEAGDFTHRFAERDVLPPDRFEDAQADFQEAQALTEQLKLLQGGAPALFWKKLGWSEEEVTELVAEQSAMAAAAEEARQVQAQAPALPEQSVASQNGGVG